MIIILVIFGIVVGDGFIQLFRVVFLVPIVLVGIIIIPRRALVIVLCAFVVIIAIGCRVVEDGRQNTYDEKDDDGNQTTFFLLFLFFDNGLLVIDWAIAFLVGNLGFQSLVQFIDGVCLVSTFVTDSTFTTGLVFVDYQIAVAVPIDTKSLSLGNVFTDEEARHVLRRQMVGSIPGL